MNNIKIKSLASALIFSFFIFLAVGSMENEKSTRQIQNQTPEYNITARQLFSEYGNNEVAADIKYKGKIAIISGTIDRIGKDITDTAYITFEIAPDELTSVQCMFNTEANGTLAQLRKGQYVQIKGKIDGKFGNILIRNSQIQ